MDAFVRCNGTILAPSTEDTPVSTEVYQRTLGSDALTEQWVTVTNQSTSLARIERVDTVQFVLPAGNHEILYFRSAWGAEFDPVRILLDRDILLYNRTGRSCQGLHPWFAVFTEDGSVIAGTVMWSGNWIVRFEVQGDGSIAVSAGLDDWEFYKDLAPGESMESPHVVIARGADLNETSVAFARAGRAWWYPTPSLSATLPVEWNPWWVYEDKEIDEAVFLRNAEVAADLGFDICTMDAGWFGPSDPATHWFDYRGDWDLVNTVRFPNGIRALSDLVHEKGMKFGLWCEIEAVGQSAKLVQTNPELVALRDGAWLGYACFGNPQTQEWAFETLDRLITAYRCDWIKLDFNLDPGAGCNRTDHGHGAGDGLFEHYQGYYRVLSRIRSRHPHVILENCASGGLRTDLGLLSQTHTTFLSDPDWSEHSLQVFWGATTMLAPEVCLHWGNSEWLGEHPHQTFHILHSDMSQHELDYHVRVSMLGGMGFSQRLPDAPDWIRARYAHHIDIYQRMVRRFVSEGDLYRLTDQPQRDGMGARWAGFQYALPAPDEHLLFMFRLDGSQPGETIRLKRLRRDRTYTLTWLSEERVEERTGASLMDDGLTFSDMREQESCLVVLR